MTYRDYFDVDEKYFPNMDESAMKDADWKATYPHETFIALLNDAAAMLDGNTGRSLWIHGAYGTGKSQCAFALRKILEASDEELDEYWGKYEPLRNDKTGLLTKLKGHKKRGIVTAFRYASGNIDTPTKFFSAVQDTVLQALSEHNCEHIGVSSRQSIIDYLSKTAQKNYFNDLLKKPEWNNLFPQSNADEIIDDLGDMNNDATDLIDNIEKLCTAEGIRISMDADTLRSWIIEVTRKNNIQIVFFWDEFSDFFKNNKNTLGEFQKIVTICQEAPFYLVIVTHPFTSISGGYGNDEAWKVVQSRFDKREISLPDNIAFDLIGNAFVVKDLAKDNWKTVANGLDGDISSSKLAVMDAAKIKRGDVIKSILPIHPMTALVLKNIASAFQSNQRSMFDFIKSPKKENVKAFQWYIENYGPDSDRPLLTVDMLWDFFYENGKEYLTDSIRSILDTFSLKSDSLNDDEKTVLKAVLIMQAISTRINDSLPVVRPTDQNLTYAFEGVRRYETSAKNIAQGLVGKGILVAVTSNGAKTYQAAVLAGDGARLETIKKELRDKTTTQALIEGVGLSSALGLTPALKLRYCEGVEKEMPGVSSQTFITTLKKIDAKGSTWNFKAVLALAKDEGEAGLFREDIKKVMESGEYRDILVIDALSSPLGMESLDRYIEKMAMSIYYQGSDKNLSRKYDQDARSIIATEWARKIASGQFYVYDCKNPNGYFLGNRDRLLENLQDRVLSKYEHVMDFTKGITESQLKLMQPKSIALQGMGGAPISGIINGCQRYILGQLWGRDGYWNDPDLQQNHIVVVKKALDELISEEFGESGQISMNDICEYLEREYGYSPCNLTVFIIGFLLKEYSSGKYRFVDSNEYSDSMTAEKLSEMIAGYFGKNKSNPTYILMMTKEEMSFYEFTGKVWGIDVSTFSAPKQTTNPILGKMRGLGYPIWVLEEVDNGTYSVLTMYLNLIKSKEEDTLRIAKDIGVLALQRPEVVSKLREMLTREKCEEGMRLFLEKFDGGELMSVVRKIGAEERVLADISDIFTGVEYSALWENDTGEKELRKLIVDYRFIEETNGLLNVSCNTKSDAFLRWRESLNFLGISCDVLRECNPGLNSLLTSLLAIYNIKEILPDAMKRLVEDLSDHYDEIKDIMDNPSRYFTDVYKAYLTDLTDDEIDEVRKSIGGLFGKSSAASKQTVKEKADEFKKAQVKRQLMTRWNELTGTKNPIEWSRVYETPILCCVDDDEYDEAKNAFETINGANQNDESFVKAALEFLNASDEFFVCLQDREYVDKKFKDVILGEYGAIVTVEQARTALGELSVETYEWIVNPLARKKINELAAREYSKNGYEKAVDVIDSMDDGALRKMIKELVADNISLGIKIISGEEE